MRNNVTVTLCRICLEDGATLSIFEKNGNEDSIHTKLSKCFSEKIEDIDGYPRNICESCNNTLQSVCEFINKYKNSCKILENGLLIVKEETEHYSDYSYNEQSEVEIEIKDIKKEDEAKIYTEPEHLESLLKPVQVKTKRKFKSNFVNKTTCTKRIKSLPNNKTKRIASSILEGDFAWNGERWCLSSNKTTFPSQNKQIKTIIQKKIEIVKPKVKKSKPLKLCDLCGEVFKNQNKLSVHKKKAHFKKPVKCPKCPRICCSTYYLNRHIKRKHEDDKNFVCSICGGRFAYKGELTTHYRNVHNKNAKPKKVFACKLCDKTYKCAKSVLVHERSVHTGERPAVCTECGTSFFHEDYLKEHMRLHTGETPFKCPICERGYAQRCNMKSHLRIHRISELDAVTLGKIRPSYLKRLKV